MSFPITTFSFASDATLLAVADAVLKATLLLAAAVLTSVALRRASAATRHLVWILALLAALALPALSLVLPRWELPLVTLQTTPEPPVQASDRAAPSTLAASPPAAVPAPALPETTAAPDRPSGRGPISTASGALPQISPRRLIAFIWLAGVIAVAARLVVGLIGVAWMSRRTERVTDAPWQPVARSLAAEIGVSPQLTFLRSPQTTMPMAWGILKPAVLMPADADNWPLDRLRLVLLHELAHVKRRDCLTHALAQLACAVYWFNPLFWVAARHARTERERACDDLVLATGTPGADYADQLLEIARVMRAGRFPALLTGATLAMAHRSQLEGRLIAILDPRTPRSGLSRLRAAATTALVACALIPVASVQPWAHAGVESSVEHVLTPGAEPEPAVLPDQDPAPRPRPRPDPQPRPSSADVAPQVARETTRAVSEALRDGVLDGVVEGVLGGTVEGALTGVLDSLAEIGRAGGQTKSATADPRMVQALTAALKDSDVEVREAAMQALAQLRDPSVFEPLVQALRDASPDIREHAAMALGNLRDPRAVQPLTGAIKDANADVREQAAFALGQLRDRGAVPALTIALTDANADVREQAAFALGQLRDRSTVAPLSAALADANDDVREQAVFALGQLRDPAAIDGLVKALRDQKPDVREQAAFALGQIRDARAVSPLISALKDENADVREQAAFALGQLRDRGAVEALVIALKDIDPDVREQVAFALGQLGDPRAIEGLTDALKDSHAEVRKQAAFALGQLAR